MSSGTLRMLHHLLTLQIRHPLPDERALVPQLREQRRLVAEAIVDAEDREAGRA